MISNSGEVGRATPNQVKDVRKLYSDINGEHQGENSPTGIAIFKNSLQLHRMGWKGWWWQEYRQRD